MAARIGWGTEARKRTARHENLRFDFGLLRHFDRLFRWKETPLFGKLLLAFFLFSLFLDFFLTRFFCFYHRLFLFLSLAALSRLLQQTV